ncbi:hypothetical protein GA0115242_12135 [Streptomyces sp. SolWspMP-5a-2]|nr:hypothetical protein GA0115242_12135 [Streptomyces sp. SolWspMP-5a-2]
MRRRLTDHNLELQLDWPKFELDVVVPAISHGPIQLPP